MHGGIAWINTELTYITCSTHSLSLSVKEALNCHRKSAISLLKINTFERFEGQTNHTIKTVLLGFLLLKIIDFQRNYGSFSENSFWTLGRLRGIKNFSAKEHCLKKIDCCVWGPLVFLRLENPQLNEEQSSDDKCLAGHLGPLYSALEEVGFSNKLSLVRTKHYKINCNWKVFVDNYLDGGYHVEFAHKDLVSLLDPKSYSTEIHKGFSIQSVKSADGASRVEGKAVYAHVFPNLLINRYGPWLDVNYVIPVSAEQCVVVFDWLLDKSLVANKTQEELEEFIKHDIQASDKVQMEDTWLCERVQKGLRSRSFTAGRYAPRVEHADHDFHVALSHAYNAVINQ